MEHRIKIGDFVKLTGSTLKTVNYYHKIGLLPAPQRTDGGYRLYGLEELNRMRLIKHLKSLGMDLKQIKEIIGGSNNQRTSGEVLQSLRSELLSEKQTLEERIVKIDTILSNNAPLLDEDCFESASFQMITEILGRIKLRDIRIPARKFIISTAGCPVSWMISSGVTISGRVFVSWPNILKTTPNNMNWHWRQVSVGRKFPTLMKMIPESRLSLVNRWLW